MGDDFSDLPTTRPTAAGRTYQRRRPSRAPTILLIVALHAIPITVFLLFLGGVFRFKKPVREPAAGHEVAAVAPVILPTTKRTAPPSEHVPEARPEPPPKRLPPTPTQTTATPPVPAPIPTAPAKPTHRPKWTADGGSSPFWALAVAANGRAATGGLDRTARVWEPDGTEIHSFANSVGLEAGIALSRDGNLLLTGGNDPMPLGRLQIGNDCVLRALSLKTLKPTTVGVHPTYVSCIGLSPNGRQALTGSDRFLRLWDVVNARDLRPAGLVGHTGRVWGVAFHPKANQAVSVAHDNTARVWDLAGGKSTRVIGGLPGVPHGVAYSPDGRAILVWGAGAVGVWDAVTGSPLLTAATIHDPILANAEAACWTPDGTIIVGGTAGVALIDPTNGHVLHQFDSPPSPIHSVGVSGDGRFVYAAGRGLACWEMSAAEPK